MQDGYTQAFGNFPDSIKNAVKFVVTELNPDQLVLFGSRARGDHRPDSDFDFVVVGCRSTANWSKVSVALAEEPLTLYKIDLLRFEELSAEYKAEVEREGVRVYDKIL